MNTSASRKALLDLSSLLLAAVGCVGCNLVIGIEPFHEAAGEDGAEDGGGASGGPCGYENPATAAYSYAWSASYGQVFNSTAAAAYDGSIFLAGEAKSPISFGGDVIDADGFVVKLDPDGKHLWSRGVPMGVRQPIAAGTSGSVTVTGLVNGQVDFGGGVMDAGAFGSSAVVGYDSAGGYRWARVYSYGQFGDNANEILTVAASRDDSVLVSGYFYHTIDLGDGPRDIQGAANFLAKYDYAGKLVWGKVFGTGSGTAPRIAVDSYGYVILVGGYYPMVDFGGGPMNGGGDSDNSYFVKLDPNGGHVWSKLIGVGGSVFISADNIYIAGTFGYGGKSVDPGGGPLTSAGDEDIYLAKYNGAGELLFAKTFGGVGNQTLSGVAGNDIGSIFLKGSFEGKLSFGDCTLPKKEGLGMFIVKLNGDGKLLFGERLNVTSGSVSNYDQLGMGSDWRDNILLGGALDYTEVDLGGSPLAAGSVFAARLKPSATN